MGADGTLTWRELLDETALRIGAKPQARWLCEEASGYSADEFRDVLDTQATERCVAHLDAMVARVLSGEPLQYVLGHWAFRTLDLMVDPRVLIPRPETELIVDIVKEMIFDPPRTQVRARDRRRVVVDLGTGSGAIGLAVAAESPRDSVTVWLTDESEDALAVARANVAGLGARASVVRLAIGNWFAALPDEIRGEVDVIVSNPPYIADGDPEVEKLVELNEPRGALFAGPEGLDDIRQIVESATEWLRSDGSLVIEIGYKQGEQATSIAKDAGFHDVEIRKDLSGRDRFLICRLKG